MSDDTKITKLRQQTLPEWNYDKKGRQRLQGRWNMQRVAEYLITKPEWHTVDDLARVVYGTTSKTLRMNVRKHIPAQRRHMIFSMDQPFVTSYGERGKIRSIKLYNRTNDYDRSLLKIELDRLLERKEITDVRYEHLVKTYSLPKGGE